MNQTGLPEPETPPLPRTMEEMAELLPPGFEQTEYGGWRVPPEELVNMHPDRIRQAMKYADMSAADRNAWFFPED
jgi:hypothetical protein